jgi:hypothetical protein
MGIPSSIRAITAHLGAVRVDASQVWSFPEAVVVNRGPSDFPFIVLAQ